MLVGAAMGVRRLAVELERAPVFARVLEILAGPGESWAEAPEWGA